MSMIDAIPLLAGAGADGGYQISRSVRLRSSASGNFQKTFSSAGNQKIWTWSGWVKRGILSADQYIFEGYTSDTNRTFFRFPSDNTFVFSITSSDWLQTTAVFRDPSAWYHIVVAFDSTQSTNTNRVKLYVNGVQQTLSATVGTGWPTLNTNYYINGANSHTIGRWNGGIYLDGYLTEINFIDGQALTPSSFGETNALTGVWQPKRYAGTYGTNGFYLNFSDNSGVTATTIGKDYSGNGNNWTPNNISVTAGTTYDSMIDVPTPYADGGNGRGNYAVLNPLLSAGGTTANGNLQVTTATGVGHSRATIAMPASGKWYCEFTAVSAATATDYIFGIVGADTAEASYGYNQTPSYSYTAFGERVVNGTFTASFYSSYTTGDVIGCAVNLDANEITWYKNGVAQTAISITNGSYFWIVSDASGTRQITAAFNAGQRPFTYTPPTGFVALNTQNLPTPTISNGATVMAATLYTGNDPSTQTITNTVNGVSFQPDLVWVKSRSNAYTHVLVDSVRGVSTALFSNLTNAEVTETTRYVYAFNSNGFSVKENISTGSVNATAGTYVGWQWNAGGSTVTNTSGTISSQVRANATAGFSVVTYTGTGANATIGHGLGVAPSMVIVKRRNGGGTENWMVYHVGITTPNANPGNNRMLLNLTNASNIDTTIWNNTNPASTVFSIGTSSEVNANTGTYVAYCFAAVAGYSAFGKYTGNGSNDGPFIYLGFRPRFVLIKSSTSAENWWLLDSARDPYNVASLYLHPNTSGAESSFATVDFLSNGFKLRYNGAAVNASGATLIYAAFAENPFKLSLAR